MKAIIALLLALSSSLLSSGSYAQDATNDYFNKEREYASMSQDITLDIETRVSAVLALGQYQGANALIGIARASRDDEAKLRVAAIEAVRGWSDLAKWDVASPLLNDENSSVSRSAIHLLLPLQAQLNEQQFKYLERHTERYLSSLGSTLNNQLEKAQLLTLLTRYPEAEALYHSLFDSVDKQIVNISVSLAYSQLLLQQNKTGESIAFLTQQVSVYNRNTELSSLHYQLGISYLKSKQLEAAQLSFGRAYGLTPTNQKFGYSYAASIQSSQPKLASDIFKQLYRDTGDPSLLYATCQSQMMASLDAKECMNRLGEIAPVEVVEQLRSEYTNS